MTFNFWILFNFLNLNYFNNFIIFGYFIFLIGIFSLSFGQKNLLFFMVYIELMFLGLSFNFVCISFFTENLEGYIYAFLILNLAAAESAVGLSLLVTLFSIKKNILFKSLTYLRG